MKWSELTGRNVIVGVVFNDFVTHSTLLSTSSTDALRANADWQESLSALQNAAIKHNQALNFQDFVDYRKM